MKSGSGAFDIDEFVSRLVTFMGGRRSLGDHSANESDAENEGGQEGVMDWEKIGRKALAKSRRVPAMGFMSGHSLQLCVLTDNLLGLGPCRLNRRNAPLESAPN
jgi:hypothetical protein